MVDFNVFFVPYIYHKFNSFWSCVHQLSYGAPLCWCFTPFSGNITPVVSGQTLLTWLNYNSGYNVIIH